MLTRKAEIIAPITFVPTALVFVRFLRSSRLKYQCIAISIGTSNSKTRRFTRVITFYRFRARGNGSHVRFAERILTSRYT